MVLEVVSCPIQLLEPHLQSYEWKSAFLDEKAEYEPAKMNVRIWQVAAYLNVESILAVEPAFSPASSVR